MWLLRQPLSPMDQSTDATSRSQTEPASGKFQATQDDHYGTTRHHAYRPHTSVSGMERRFASIDCEGQMLDGRRRHDGGSLTQRCSVADAQIALARARLRMPSHSAALLLIVVTSLTDPRSHRKKRAAACALAREQFCGGEPGARIGMCHRWVIRGRAGRLRLRVLGCRLISAGSPSSAAWSSVGTAASPSPISIRGEWDLMASSGRRPLINRPRLRLARDHAMRWRSHRETPRRSDDRRQSV